MSKMIRLLLFLFFFSLSACSIQVSGLQNAYESPTNGPNVAMLHVASKNVRLISIDGKSMHGRSIALKPGMHQFSLYSGKNNYISDINHMIVLSARIKAGITYYIKTNNQDVWIENSLGSKVSSIDSQMSMSKSVSL
jgi:hypothetical protein